MAKSTSRARYPRTNSPPGASAQAGELAGQLATLSTEELAKILRVNHRIAATNRLRYSRFHDDAKKALPALAAYTGIVFKRIAPADFTAGDFEYAQAHLNITSFLYGLLRPLDAIRTYRLEGDAVLPGHGEQTVFEYWQDKLTDAFLEKIKADDGILVNLASSEMKRLFDWKRICREVRVVTPEFRIREDDRLKTVVVYTKMCRGEMTRHILKNRIGDPQQLKAFEWDFPARRVLQSRRLGVYDVRSPDIIRRRPAPVSFRAGLSQNTLLVIAAKSIQLPGRTVLYPLVADAEPVHPHVVAAVVEERRDRFADTSAQRTVLDRDHTAELTSHLVQQRFIQRFHETQVVMGGVHAFRGGAFGSPRGGVADGPDTHQRHIVAFAQAAAPSDGQRLELLAAPRQTLAVPPRVADHEGMARSQGRIHHVAQFGFIHRRGDRQPRHGTESGHVEDPVVRHARPRRPDRPGRDTSPPEDPEWRHRGSHCRKPAA